MQTKIKMKFLGNALLIILVMTNFSKSQAQINSARVIFTPTTNNLNTGTFQIELSDSTGISEVEVQLIDPMEDSLMFERIYVFDQTAGLPNTITWQRQGTNVQMGMGNFPERLAWNGKVRVKTTIGVWSDWLEFLFN